MAPRAGPRRARFARRRAPSSRRRSSRPLARRLSPPRRPGACAVLRADTIGQGRRPGRADAADLAGLGHRPRHQGRELGLTAGWRARFGRVLLFDPTNTQERRLQSAARGPPRRMGSARRPEHRRRAGRSRRRAGTPEPLGEDQPFAAGRHDPACALRRAGQDARRRRQLPVRSEAADRDDAARDDDDAASGRRRAFIPSSPAPRASCSTRARTSAPACLSTAMSFLGLYRDPVVADRHAALRLAHPRSRRGRAPGDALPRRAAVGHQPDQAARPA